MPGKCRKALCLILTTVFGLSPPKSPWRRDCCKDRVGHCDGRTIYCNSRTLFPLTAIFAHAGEVLGSSFCCCSSDNPFLTFTCKLVPAIASSRRFALSGASQASKVIFQFLYTTINPPQTNLKSRPMLLILRWICFYPGQQAQVRISLSPIRNHESQPTTQLPVKKFEPENYFSPQICVIWMEWSHH